MPAAGLEALRTGISALPALQAKTDAASRPGIARSQYQRGFQTGIRVVTAARVEARLPWA